MMRALLPLNLAVALSACGGDPRLPVSKSQALLATMADKAGAREIATNGLPDGGMTLGGQIKGRQFALAIPPNWNRQALLFAHGYSMPGSPVRVAVNPVSKDQTGGLMKVAYDQGFAVGHSAFDKAGIGVESGARNTLALKYFVQKIGATRIYVSGGSMGGNIVMALIERHPDEFSGALAACGVTQGWEEEIGALVDMRAVYTYFTAGTDYALPGNSDIAISALSPTPPRALGFAGTPWRLIQMKRFASPVLKLFEDAKADPHGKAAQIVARVASLTRFEPEVASFIFPLLTISFGMDDMRASFGGNVYGNKDKVYRSALLSDAQNAALNKDIQRIAADPRSQAYADAWHRTTGKFKTPLVAIHNRIDSLVPYDQAVGLGRQVAAASNQGRLIQLTFPPLTTPIPGTDAKGYAHCGFEPAQIARSWNILRQWVETGQKPDTGEQ